MERLSIMRFLCVAIAITLHSVQAKSPPHMVRQPPHELFYKISDPNQEDRPIVLECEAQGDPVPEYKWTKNGQLYSVSGSDDRVAQEPGRGTLTIHRPKVIDEGLYQCWAENSYGTSLSNAVYLRRAGLDAFQSGNIPEDLTVEEGKPLTMKCSPPTGTPRPHAFWVLQSPGGAMQKINGSRISVDPEGDLHFSNVTMQDASGDNSYACSAYSPFLKVYATGDLKKLLVKPRGSATPNYVAPICQYTSPRHMVGMLGRSIDISCIYGGTPLPQIRWERENAPLPPRRHLVTEFGKVMRINDLEFEDQGTYKCTASNGRGQIASHTFNLTIESEPYWINVPESVRTAEEEDHEFSCIAGGIPAPRIQWFVNGVPIENALPKANRVANGNNITLTNVQKEDTANFQCNASNAHGYIFADVYINVRALPANITQPPREVSEAVQGSVATVICRVYGAPHPIVIWEKDGQTVNVQPGTGSRYEMTRNGDLIINGASAADAGNYTCTSRNRLGQTRASGRLDIKSKTTIKAPPVDIDSVAGESATFRCSADADPNVDVQIEWTRDDQPIKPSESGRVFQSNDNSLTISRVQEIDSGVYKCIARTRLDHAEASASLLVRDVPNPPINVRVHCEQRAASVAWEPNGDNREPILEYIIQYSTSFELGNWVGLKTGILPNDHSESLDLSPWANYTFRVLARNKIGMSNASAPSQQVCSTPPDVPYKNPDDVQGRGSQPNNFVISWTPMPQIDHNGPGFHYEVRYLRVDEARSERDAARVENVHVIRDWRQGSLVVTDQPTYVPYDVRVIAVNDFGPSKTANDPPVRGFSGEDEPTTAPGTPLVNNILDGRTAKISWLPVPADSVRGEFKGYKIKVTPEGESEPREVRVGPNATSAIVDILKPDSANNIQVVAYNGQYDGPLSDKLVVITPSMPPGGPSDFKAYPMGRHALFLEWKLPIEPNGNLTHYEMDVSEVNGRDVTEPIPDVSTNRVDLREKNIKLKGLKADTKYRIKLYAVNDKGRGEAGIAESSTEPNRTSEALALLPPPGPPEFLTAGTTNDSIIIAWQPQAAAEAGHRTGEHFYVQYKRVGDGEWKKTDPVMDSLQTEITPLEPGTTYHLRVVAVEGNQEVQLDKKPPWALEKVDTTQCAKVCNKRFQRSGICLGTPTGCYCPPPALH